MRPNCKSYPFDLRPVLTPAKDHLLGSFIISFMTMVCVEFDY